MSDNQRFRFLTILVLVLALGLAAQTGSAASKAGTPAAAKPPASGTWLLRFGGLGVDSDWTEDDYRTHRGRNESAGGGLGVSAEYRFSDRLGAEVGVLAAAEVNVRLGQPFGTDTLGFTAVTGGLNVHLTPDRKVDVYLGPLFARLHYADVGADFVAADPGVHFPWWPNWVPGTRAHLAIDDDFAFGANLGLDVRFGRSHWTFSSAFKYLTANLEGTTSWGDRARVDLEPFIVSVGAGYRF